MTQIMIAKTVAYKANIQSSKYIIKTRGHQLCALKGILVPSTSAAGLSQRSLVQQILAHRNRRVTPLFLQLPTNPSSCAEDPGGYMSYLVAALQSELLDLHHPMRPATGSSLTFLILCPLGNLRVVRVSSFLYIFFVHFFSLDLLYTKFQYAPGLPL